ncbi:MAG TPA: enoyl-CoA hydratase-related protein [Solirubrobacteraceae bacterium]|nr:enoyl-CoA hydratase-related protein [Solirubrobacteraceae bacterium]
MADEVELRRDGNVAVLALNAPARRNALTVAMAQRMAELCDQIDADPEIGAVVVYGEGGYFCAGGDRGALSAAGRDPATPESFTGMGTIYNAFARVGTLEPPTVAAVTGGAVGAGMNLLLATDLRIVATDARLLSGFGPIGFHPGGGHLGLLASRGSRELAAALGLFGQRIDGREAVERGVAWAAVEPDDVLSTALELARTPAKDPALARLTTRSFRLTVGPPALPWPAALEIERPAQMWSMRRRALED